MASESWILLTAAASIGFIHTLLGPDHYLPFIMMSFANDWSRRKTMWITVLCGLGHVMSSVVLGLLGIAFGLAVARLELIEGFRGNLAGWALIAFGLVYFIWGMQRAVRNRPHKHFHTHADHLRHSHMHIHDADHLHVHQTTKTNHLTPWVLFTIFVLGPCEPLIPLLMYPAANHNMTTLVWVVIIFSTFTITTMLTIVLLATWGIRFISIRQSEKYVHAISGATIFLCGLGIQFLGL